MGTDDLPTRCIRCDGLLLKERNPTPHSEERYWEYKYCVNCGDMIDHKILLNRRVRHETNF